MSNRLLGPLLVLPALLVLLLLFAYPLAYSVVGAFRSSEGVGFANFVKSFELYRRDIVFTFLIVGLSTVLIAVFSVAIGGYLVLGNNPTAVAILRWLYRWPLFIPFIVAGQLMRTFLAKNGLMNGMLVEAGLLTPLQTISLLDWRGIVIAFVWKQTPFVALLVSGAMAGLDRSMFEAAQQSRGREVAYPGRDHRAAGGADAARGPDPQLRDHALGALRALDDQRPDTDHDHRQHGLSHQRLWRLRRRQCARRDLLPDGRCSRLDLPSLCGPRADGSAMSGWRWLPRGIVLGVIAFVVFGPLVNMLLWAFTERWYFPHTLPLEYGFSFWGRVFAPRGGAVESLTNSVLIAVGTVGLSLALAVPAGYALARLNLPFRSLILLAFLLPQAFPNLPVYINIARIFYGFGLNGTYLGVVLVHTTHGLVYAVWIATAAFAAVDRELEEAARNIGAGALHTFRTITLPLAAPGLMASAIFVFLESLDEFTGTYFVGAPGRPDPAAPALQCECGGQLPDRLDHGPDPAGPVHRLHVRGRAVLQGRRARQGGAVDKEDAGKMIFPAPQHFFKATSKVLVGRGEGHPPRISSTSQRLHDEAGHDPAGQGQDEVGEEDDQEEDAEHRHEDNADVLERLDELDLADGGAIRRQRP
jgi:putative spermidine/putrescine transport system permease protein